jgi:YkoY family integral membrane protein
MPALPISVEWADLLTIAILVVLEGILSADNALVLAVLVLPLPEAQRRQALQYGILGAFGLRALATGLAVYLTEFAWVSLVGGLYLLYLPYKHFTQHPDEEPAPGSTPRAVAGFLGLTAFWATVVRVELTDLVFAVDSILVAVAMTDKTWVIITGGVLGILMMRLLVLQVLRLVKHYPRMVDGAYIVVLWVGIKLVWEYLHRLHWVPYAIPKPVAIGGVVLLFIGCFLYARAHAHGDPGLAAAATDAEELLGPEPPPPDDREGDGRPGPGP